MGKLKYILIMTKRSVALHPIKAWKLANFNRGEVAAPNQPNLPERKV